MFKFSDEMYYIRTNLGVYTKPQILFAPNRRLTWNIF